MKKTNLKIDWATHDAAKYACENWHYSGCLPTGKIVKIGAWEDGKFIGVILFSRGASPHLLTKYNLKQNEGCELTRVALTQHKSQVTRIMKIAINFLKKVCPGIKIVISFADPEEGHHGGIYQGGNWIYTGSSSPTIEYFVKGRWRHVRGAYYSKTEDTPTRKRVGKHRYVMPLIDSLKKKILEYKQPYPKRAKQAM